VVKTATKKNTMDEGYDITIDLIETSMGAEISGSVESGGANELGKTEEPKFHSGY